MSMKGEPGPHWSSRKALDTTDRGVKKFMRGEYDSALPCFPLAAAYCRAELSDGLDNLLLIQKWASKCYETVGRSKERYNEGMNENVKMLSDVVRNVEIVKEEYIDRYGVDPGIDEKSRKSIENAIADLQALLADKPEHPAKRRRTTGTNSRVFPLPNKIISAVLGYLSIPDLRSAALVSHQWNDAVMTLSGYLTDPCFTLNPSVAEVQCYLKLCHRHNITLVGKMRIPWVDCGQESQIREAVSISGVKVTTLEIGKR